MAGSVSIVSHTFSFVPKFSVKPLLFSPLSTLFPSKPTKSKNYLRPKILKTLINPFSSSTPTNPITPEESPPENKPLDVFIFESPSDEMPNQVIEETNKVEEFRVSETSGDEIHFVSYFGTSKRETELRETVTRVMQEEQVIIVGAGPSGLATAACLNLHSIPYIILEREDCFASLWKKYAYDRLHLHLDKQFCALPHMSFPDSYPRFISKEQFVSYLDDYVSHFKISPLYRRCVELAKLDEASKKWIVKARNLGSGEIEDFTGRFLVVASGETSNPYTPDIEGLNTFPGDVLHSTMFRNGKAFRNKTVLVVGSGNSGMEISLDLANYGAKTSIVVRSPVHILSREMMYLLKYIPVNMADPLMVLLSKLVYGDLTKYGITRPKEGPFFMKAAYGKYPILDVGTCKKIKSREIQVLPAILSIRGNEVVFENGKTHPFDTIVFCTGFKRSTNIWLKGDDYLLNDDGMAKPSFPNHWKGKNGLYCVGLSGRGLHGASADAKNIASDIKLYSVKSNDSFEKGRMEA